jgi:hypothetical protein
MARDCNDMSLMSRVDRQAKIDTFSRILKFEIKKLNVMLPVLNIGFPSSS